MHRGRERHVMNVAEKKRKIKKTWLRKGGKSITQRAERTEHEVQAPKTPFLLVYQASEAKGNGGVAVTSEGGKIEICKRWPGGTSEIKTRGHRQKANAALKTFQMGEKWG